MTDLTTASIAIILGKYALDKGIDLAKEVGPAAAGIAGELARKVLGHLRKEPKGEMVADEFEQDPETYQKPLEKKLDEAIEADPGFVAQLQGLLAQFEEAAKAHAVASGAVYKGIVRGSGALVQGPGAQAAGERGVVAGDVGGPIITGDHHVIHITPERPASGNEPIAFEWTDAVSGRKLTGEVDPAALRGKLAAYFSNSELDILAFDLGVEAEEIGGQTRSEKARLLIAYFAQRGRLPELLAACHQERPKVDWFGG